MKPAPNRQAGYTIIEVMIFLAVSGALVLSAFGLFSGRIQRTQFTQAVQAFDSRLKTTANSAATGTFPETPFSCTTPGNEDPIINPLSGGAQGTRTACIFVGKVVAPASTCSAPLTTTKCEAVDIYSVVGRRNTPSNQVPSGLINTPTNQNNGASPTVILDPDVTQTVNLGYGTKITGIYQPTAWWPLLTSGVGFFQSFNGNYTDGNLASGAQGVETWAVRSTVVNPFSPLPRDELAAAVHTEKMNKPGNNSKMYICFKSADNKQYASIEIGSINGAVSTNVRIGGPLCQNGN